MKESQKQRWIAERSQGSSDVSDENKKKEQEYISNQEDIHFLKMVYALINEYDKSDERISIEQYNKELNEAEARIDAGKYISHEDLEKEAKKW